LAVFVKPTINQGNKTMDKLVAAFTANPNAKTAARLLKHLYKHPMCECFLDSDIKAAAKKAVL
tara:strand:- start:359 stop:547 length:189 start_codon:yes stop_codon:yes gene_type:complete